MIMSDLHPGIWEPYHEVLKVALKNGEEYALDLAGAQYGHHDPIAPWIEFEQERVRQVGSSELYSLPQSALWVKEYSMKAVVQALEEGRRPLKLPCSEWRSYMPVVNIALQGWQQKEKLPLEKLWKQPENKFIILRDNLVDYIEFMGQDAAPSRVTTSKRARLLAKRNEILTRCQTPVR